MAGGRQRTHVIDEEVLGLEIAVQHPLIVAEREPIEELVPIEMLKRAATENGGASQRGRGGGEGGGGGGGGEACVREDGRTLVSRCVLVCFRLVLGLAARNQATPESVR